MHISVIFFIYNSPLEDVLYVLGTSLSETQMERHRKKEILSIFQKHWICYNNLCFRNVLARLLINPTKCFTLKWVNKSRVMVFVMLTFITNHLSSMKSHNLKNTIWNIRASAIKPLEENIGLNLHDFCIWQWVLR